MRGKIVKGIGGKYSCYTKNGIIECTAKGKFRNQNIRLVVGDDVEIENDNIVSIYERKNILKRPLVSNIDTVVFVISLKKPSINLYLVDKYIVYLKSLNIDFVICINKEDLITDKEKEYVKSYYKATDINLFFVSVIYDTGFDEFLKFINNKTILLSGASGVGKSSLINKLMGTELKSGELSKIERGKHTTRHSELFVSELFNIYDTPGFTSFDLDVNKNDLSKYYIEYSDRKCKYSSCSHIHEPDCFVKQKLEKDDIHKDRYENYKKIYNELKM